MRRFQVKAALAFALLISSSFATAFAQFGESGRPPVGTFLNPFPTAAVSAMANRDKPQAAPVVSHRHLKYPPSSGPIASSYQPYPSEPFPVAEPVAPEFTRSAPMMPSAQYPASPYPTGPACKEGCNGGACNGAAGPNGCDFGYGGYDPLMHRCPDDCRENRCAWRHWWVKTCYHPIPAYNVPNYGYHPTAWGQINNGGASSNQPIPAKNKQNATAPAPAEESKEQKDQNETPPATEPKPEQAPQTNPPDSPKPADPATPNPPPPMANELPEVEPGLAPFPAPKAGDAPLTIPSKTQNVTAPQPQANEPAEEENFLPPLPVKTPLTSNRKYRQEKPAQQDEEDAFPSVRSEETDEPAKKPEASETAPKETGTEPAIEQAPVESSPKIAPTPSELPTTSVDRRHGKTASNTRNGRVRDGKNATEAGVSSQRTSKKRDTARAERSMNASQTANVATR